MKILFVINSLGTGGAERSLSEMLPVLRAAGIEVAVVCLETRAEGVADAVATRFPVTFLSADRWLPRLRRLRRIVRDERPNVVHTSIFEADVLGRVSSWRSGATVVTSLVNTSYEPERLRDPNVKARRLELVRRVDGLTARRLTHHFHAISQAVADSAVQRLGIAPERITVVPRGRDPRRLGAASPERRARVREGLGIPLDRPVVLNVARQDYQKGHLDLLRAFEQVHQRSPEAHLLLVGRRGHATAAMEQFLATASCAGQVSLLGHREDVPDLLAAADVFVFPSHYEGLGGAVLEAMALGLPLVITRVPALLEAAEENRNALAVPVGDPAALAQALTTVLADADLRTGFGRRSAEIFRERFELDACMAQMLRMYDQLAGRSRPRAGLGR